MPFLAPSFARLPPLASLLADQTESLKNIARHLGVSLRTLQRYQASGNAPRAIYLVGTRRDERREAKPCLSELIYPDKGSPSTGASSTICPAVKVFTVAAAISIMTLARSAAM